MRTEFHSKVLVGTLALLLAACQGSDPESAGGEASPAPSSTAGADEDWAWYFGDAGATHQSRLTQITRDNVGDLTEAWRYVTEDEGRLQTTPLIVDGTMYVVSPLQKVIALNAATGEEKWVFDSGIGVGAAVRSMTWWSDGTENRLFSAVHHYIYAIDPADGTAIESFGKGGRIDLRENLRGDPEEESYHATSPAITYKDMLMLSGRVSEATPASPGDYRAFDVHTGELRWSFRTVPMAGEPGAETWPEGARKTQGGANAWGGSTIDTERGIVYIGTGSPTDDFYGGERLGDNLYSDSIVALDADTGERIWHFQAVRHDLWDTDFPAPPVLLTVTRNGERVDAVAAANKAGYMFIFDRDTGEPLFDIVETEFPATSSIPEEKPSPTQPIPVLPAPLNKLTLSREDLTDRTPEMQAWAQLQFDSLLGTDQPFTPLSVGKTTAVIPGWRGGGEYGGITADADAGIVYINVNNWVSLGTLADTQEYAASGEGERTYRAQCMGCHGEPHGEAAAMVSLAGVADRRTPAEMENLIRNGQAYMPGFPLLEDATVTNVVSFILTGEDSVPPARLRDSTSNTRYVFTGYSSFYDPEGYPAWKPPWGTLNAIDMNTGEYLWTVPYGEYEELAAQGLTGTGAENHGGTVLTETGLLFAGGTERDRKFYAFDSRNGDVLWEGRLPGFDKATPAVYAVDGKQYVVISSSPSREDGPDARSAYVAFSLP